MKDLRKGYARETDNLLDAVSQIFAKKCQDKWKSITTSAANAVHIPLLSALVEAKARSQNFSVIGVLLRKLKDRTEEEASLSLFNMFHHILSNKKLSKRMNRRLQLLKVELDILNDCSQRLMQKLLTTLPEDTSVFNLFSESSGKLGYNRRSSRYIQLLKSHGPKTAPATLLLGTYFLVQNDYEAALQNFFSAHHRFVHTYQAIQTQKLQKMQTHRVEEERRLFWRADPAVVFLSQPLILLCIGTCYTNWTVSKGNFQTRGKYQNFLKAIVWMGRYLESRRQTDRVEAYYNVGRCAHSFGIYHIAEAYYRRGLQACEENGIKEQINEDGKWIYNDLRREIAYNLAHMYKMDKKTSLGVALLRRYCVL